MSTLEFGMEKFKQDVMFYIGSKLDSCSYYQNPEMRSTLPEFQETEFLLVDLSSSSNCEDERKDTGSLNKYFIYNHPDGAFYDVPPKFKFPTSTNRINGWSL